MLDINDISFRMQSLITPYNHSWKSAFTRLKENLQVLLREFEIDIQHVGSTAIPGLAAKPILDIDIILEDKSKLAAITALLEGAGYANRGEQGIPGRFAFRQQTRHTPVCPDIQQWMEHHLYICYHDSLALKNHLLFRDALLQDMQLTAQYAALKMKLASQPGMTREEYTRQKTDFIITVLAGTGINSAELGQIGDSNR